MKNNHLHNHKKNQPETEEQPDTTGKLPVLTPEGKQEHRDVKEEETPDAEQLPVTPKQPLYEDKTETYYKEKQKKQGN